MADGRYEIAARLFAVRNGAVLKELNADEMKVTWFGGGRNEAVLLLPHPV